ncbi:MAG: hypothetical protein ACYTG5_11940 [Planctomycetota bacterium]
MSQQATKHSGRILALILAAPLSAQNGDQAWQQYADPKEAGFSIEALEAARAKAIEIEWSTIFFFIGLFTLAVSHVSLILRYY